MPVVSPSFVLMALLLLTLLPAMGAGLARLRHRRRLRLLAKSRDLSYTGRADEALASRLAPWLPLGAANVVVSNLLRSTADHPSLWVARVDYSLGSVAQRRHQSLVVAVRTGDDAKVIEVRKSPPDLTLLQQYQHLLEDSPPPTLSDAG